MWQIVFILVEHIEAPVMGGMLQYVRMAKLMHLMDLKTMWQGNCLCDKT